MLSRTNQNAGGSGPDFPHWCAGRPQDLRFRSIRYHVKPMAAIRAAPIKTVVSPGGWSGVVTVWMKSVNMSVPDCMSQARSIARQAPSCGATHFADPQTRLSSNRNRRSRARENARKLSQAGNCQISKSGKAAAFEGSKWFRNRANADAYLPKGEKTCVSQWSTMTDHRDDT
jgi:hypothetical protein